MAAVPITQVRFRSGRFGGAPVWINADLFDPALHDAVDETAPPAPSAPTPSPGDDPAGSAPPSTPESVEPSTVEQPDDALQPDLPIRSRRRR